MKKAVSLFLILALILFSVPGIAEDYTFQDDYEAIDRTAKSVMMLEIYDSSGELFATGSGFIAFDNRTLVTNYHVMEGAARIIANSDVGRQYEITGVLATDEELDIAILRFLSPTDMAPLAFAEDIKLMRGEPVVAIGSPRAVMNTVSFGNISAVISGNGSTTIQYTAPISPGSSGGVLLNDNGLVIGVVRAMLIDSQNMNYAIDIDDVADLYRKHESGQTIPLAQYSSAAAEPTSAPGLRPDTGSARVSSLTVSQTSADTVRMRWNGTAGDTFYISYEIEGNSFYSYNTTADTFYTADGLVPGSTYTFYVGTAGEDPAQAELSRSLKVQQLGDFALRGFMLNTFAIFACPAGADYAVEEGVPVSGIPYGEINRESDVYDYYAEISHALENAASGSEGDALYVLYSPSGGVYDNLYNYEYPAEANSDYRRYISLDPLFAGCLEFEGAAEAGEYRLALYYDGFFASETKFSVTGAAAAAEPEPTPAVVETAPPADAAAGTAIQLKMGSFAYWDNSGQVLSFNPEVHNSGSCAVEEFTLLFYFEDPDNALITSVSGEQYIETHYKVRVEPDTSVEAGYTEMTGFKGIRYLYAAVSEYQAANGTAVRIQDDRLEFFYWVIK